MIEETALVTRVENGRVWIKSQQGGACGSCMQQSSCGTATLAKWLPKREFALDCTLPLQSGDQVRVSIDDSGLLAGSVLIYLLPLLLMLLAVTVTAYVIPAGSAWLPELSISVLLLSFIGIHRLLACDSVSVRFRLSIVGKC